LKENELDGTVKLSKKGLTRRIVEALQIENLRPKQTPAAREALVADKEGEAADGTYRFPSFVGILQYVRSHSRPEITFAVSQCARLTQSPRRSHEVAL